MSTDFEYDEKLDRRNKWIKKKKFKFDKNDVNFKKKSPYKRFKKGFEDESEE
jgi:hypothetical protein